MSLTGSTNEERIWNYLSGKIGNDYGVAGLMGNLYAESALEPKNLQDSFEKKLGYTNETYTKAVDDGSYAGFVKDSAGYGLAQWTYWSRKQNLLNHCKEAKASIGDLEAQLNFMLKELNGSFSSVVSALKSAASVRSASDTVLTKYEQPSDQSESVKKLRASYGQKYYDKYAKGVSTVSTTSAKSEAAIKALLAVANAEIGYLEKKSASSLDSKTANAGSNNYTKYWRDVYPAFQGQAWCACFVSWCFMKTFGRTAAEGLLGHWPYTYVPTLAAKTTNKSPKKGDIVCFYRNGTFTHTGIVSEVSGQTVKTIEGNTSGGSTVISNGGGVCAKSYSLPSLSGTKFFRPDYGSATVLSSASSMVSASSGSSSSAAKSSAAATKEVKATGIAFYHEDDLAGTYKTTADLHCRDNAGTGCKSLCVIPKGTEVKCYGYYNLVVKTKWLYIQFTTGGVQYTGYSSSKYLQLVR